MPELPEVQTVVNTLRPRAVGRTIGKVHLYRPDVLTPAGTDLAGELGGRKILSVDRRGKRIVFTLDNGCRFYVHLGMTGQLTAVSGTAVSEPRPSHTHLELELRPDDGLDLPDVPSARPNAEPSGRREGIPEVIRFRDPRRFGGIWWLGREGSADQGMGPEPLTLRPARLARQLARTRRAVKVALLDQALVAGLGNIYVDEALFRAGIHPLTPASALTREQVARLSRAIKLTLRRAIRHRGSTLRDYRDADGEAGSFQGLHQVYDRAGQPCRRCRRSIERIVLGGRSTHFCAACQKKG
jgi:formamidopyrimidine-DNA glycosylase